MFSIIFDTSIPFLNKTKTATVKKLIISCIIEFSSPVMLSAFLLKITIKAYIKADIMPQNKPKEIPPFFNSIPFTKSIPNRTIINPNTFIFDNFSLKINGVTAITITGPQ